MNGDLEAVGFWSYARLDDELSDGRLSQLRRLLGKSIQQHFGRQPVKLFQDAEAISPGAEWEKEIRQALSHSAFFIPIITPNFIESPWCMEEVKIFLERMHMIDGINPDAEKMPRIFPLRYIDVTDSEPVNLETWEALDKFHGIDFGMMRFMDPSAERVQIWLARLAQNVCTTLRVDRKRPRIASTADPAVDGSTKNISAEEHRRPAHSSLAENPNAQATGSTEHLIEILAPSLYPARAGGALSRWNVKEGDSIKSGDVIAEIHTELAIIEIEAVDEGIIERLLVPAGTEGVKAETPIALLNPLGAEDKAKRFTILAPKSDADYGEALLALWRVKEGDSVKHDTVVAEIENDKVVIEISAGAEGIVEKIVTPQGVTVVEGKTPLAVIRLST